MLQEFDDVCQLAASWTIVLIYILLILLFFPGGYLRPGYNCSPDLCPFWWARPIRVPDFPSHIQEAKQDARVSWSSLIHPVSAHAHLVLSTQQLLGEMAWRE